MSLPLDRLLAYLRLAHTKGIGPVTFQRLLTVYGDPERALAALPELSARSGRKRSLKAFSLSKAKSEYAETQALGGTYLVWGEPPYPAQLTALPDAPPVLARMVMCIYWIGQWSLWSAHVTLLLRHAK